MSETKPSVVRQLVDSQSLEKTSLLYVATAFISIGSSLTITKLWEGVGIMVLGAVLLIIREVLKIQ